MLNHTGFDLWANGYDRSVGLSDEDGTYPFSGYRKVLNDIYNRILSGNCKTVLDIGFGTGTLAAKLYDQGLTVYGQDFSQKMLAIAQAKMPNAFLYRGDFQRGLVEALTQRKYDAIVATYSLHHLTDPEKIGFLRSLLPLLNDGSKLYIGDVAFPDRDAWCACKEAASEEWDDEEIYFIAEELLPYFPQLIFRKHSACAGVLEIPKE